MKNINQHGETLVSIAGIEDTFSGRYLFREIINNILPTASMIFAKASRPHFYPISMVTLIDKAAGLIENLSLDKDLFSVSFNYKTRTDNDELFYLLEELWFEFEQPCFVFYQDDGQAARTFKPDISWKKITETWSSFVLFKSVEDDVVWLGRSSGIRLPIELIPHADD